MRQLELFDTGEFRTVARHNAADGNRCLHCRHRQRWEMGSTVVQYCSKRQSGRTLNGLMRIKCKQQACTLFEDMRHRMEDVYHYSDADETAILRLHDKGRSDAEIAERLLRTPQGIKKKRRRMQRGKESVQKPIIKKQ